MIIKVKVWNVYGRETIYPMNETAEKLCKFKNRKSFNRKDLEVLSELGFKIEEVPAYSLSEPKQTIRIE